MIDMQISEGDAVTFDSPYEQYAYRNGRGCTIVSIIDKEDIDHDAEVLPMYVVRFGDGTTIEAWPEELRYD